MRFLRAGMPLNRYRNKAIRGEFQAKPLFLRIETSMLLWFGHASAPKTFSQEGLGLEETVKPGGGGEVSSGLRQVTGVAQVSKVADRIPPGQPSLDRRGSVQLEVLADSLTPRP